MREINPQKVFSQYRDPMKPYGPLTGRKYTITHSDVTAELFVFIADAYAEDQVTEMRDEVRIEWRESINGFYLQGSVVVDGPGVAGNPELRYAIFTKEMPTALQALRLADRFLFEQFPALDDSPVLIRFVSANPAYDKTYDFGVIGEYI